MNRGEWYSQKPYLRGESFEKIRERYGELFLPMIETSYVNGQFKIGPDYLGNFGKASSLRQVDCLQETYIRKIPQSILSPLQFDQVGKLMRFAQIVSEQSIQLPNLVDKNGIFKFGKRKYLEEWLTGKVRINSAFTFEKLENVQQQDEELRKQILINHYGGFPKELMNKLFLGDAFYQPLDLGFDSPFFISCFSNRYRERLFSDFNADCVLHIKDENEFLSRLVTAIKTYNESWLVESDNVHYFDPYLWDLNDKDLKYLKHFRYHNQYEYRICILPNVDEFPEEQFLSLNCGNLSDIIEMHVIEGLTHD